MQFEEISCPCLHGLELGRVCHCTTAPSVPDTSLRYPASQSTCVLSVRESVLETDGNDGRTACPIYDVGNPVRCAEGILVLTTGTLFVSNISPIKTFKHKMCCVSIPVYLILRSTYVQCSSLCTKVLPTGTGRWDG